MNRAYAGWQFPLAQALQPMGLTLATNYDLHGQDRDQVYLPFCQGRKACP